MSDTSFAPFVKFNMAAVNRRFLLEGWFSILKGAFNVNDDGKDKEPIDFGFEKSSRRGNFGILLLGTQCMLESGFHMIAAIATIAEIELKSISAIVVTAIAGEWFPYDRSDCSDHMETSL